MTTWYERHVLPYLIDWGCGLPMATRQRQVLVPRAHGRVLEVGVGTGLNLRHYDQQQVQSLTALDPAEQLHHLARRRAERAGLQVALLGLSAERIPLPDHSFDTVVMTWTLCSIPDPLAALREMRRVLVPQGQLLFCEHGLSPEPAVQRWQHRLEPYWRPCAGGCHLTRDVPHLLRTAGFHLPELEQRYLTRPHTLGYHYWGRASA